MSRLGGLSPILFAWVIAAFLGGCERKLDEGSFRRKAEQAFAEANPGWTILEKRDQLTTFVRGDQLDTLDMGALYLRYDAQGQSGSAFLEGWKKELQAEAEGRRRTLQQAEAEVIPILKGGSWVRVQDVGAIGPRHLQDKIRPWRREVASDLYVVLGVPEEKLGYRFASLEEVASAGKSEEEWLARAVQNLAAKVGKGDPAELRGSDGRLLVLDLPNDDGVSALVLDAAWRRAVLERFGQTELGAAVPIRNVLIVFDTSDVVATKPVRARAHQLYDTQNHPGFRGLLRIDAHGVSVLEPAKPAN